jgi:hypothetical protein
MSLKNDEKKNDEEKDNRLFPGTKLYCEGRERTALRGRLHLYACLSFFPMLLINYLYIFINEEVNLLAFFACFSNFMIIFIAHCISAFYHISELPVHLEIIAQKMDILGANFYIASSYLPMALVLFPLNVGIILLTLVSGILGWNVYSIINSTYSLYQPAFLVVPQILFAYYVYNYLSCEQLWLNCIGIASLAIASIFLYIEIPYFTENKYFSNFEIYHSFSLICLSTICLMNYSTFTAAHQAAKGGAKGGAKG